MGLQSYSSPTPNHVIFATNYPELLDGILQSFPDAFPVVQPLIGSYKGVVENSYCITEASYVFLMRQFPQVLSGQESVLILGVPQARNWRPARLKFLDGRPDVDLGVFYSTDEQTARASEGWTSTRDGKQFWICEVDPPINEDDRKRRATKRAIKALLAPGNARGNYGYYVAQHLAAIQPGLDLLLKDL